VQNLQIVGPGIANLTQSHPRSAAAR
jgi:hypothetical protein